MGRAKNVMDEMEETPLAQIYLKYILQRPQLPRTIVLTKRRFVTSRLYHFQEVGL